MRRTGDRWQNLRVRITATATRLSLQEQRVPPTMNHSAIRINYVYWEWLSPPEACLKTVWVGTRNSTQYGHLWDGFQAFSPFQIMFVDTDLKGDFQYRMERWWAPTHSGYFEKNMTVKTGRRPYSKDIQLNITKDC